MAEGHAFKIPSWYRRQPFLRLARFTKDELYAVDGFVKFAREARQSEKERLERLAADDDWAADALYQLDEFAALFAEVAIFALWRCVELYRTNAIRIASGERASARAFRHKEFQKELLRLGISEQRIRCARSVDELRCLNNAIKHSQRVNDALATFPRWRRKKGRKLNNLEAHYARSRPAAERYVTDLARRLSRRVTT